MNKFMKAIAAIMLIGSMVGFVGCKSTNVLNGKKHTHEYVDLGLPSGTLWATCNIGADKPEDFGDYFAWGETRTKTTYDWKTYKYANGDYEKLTKYCNDSDFGDSGFTDNLTTLQDSDDPATAAWGSGWQTPSMAQWEELLSNTTNKWTAWNSINGWLFTATNGQTLFLPAAGCLLDDDDKVDFAGSNGYYWSNSLHTDHPYGAWMLYFYSNYWDYCGMSSTTRDSGHSVRAVRSTRQN